MAAEEYIIQTEELRKAFYSRQQRRQIQAIKGIHLSIRPGETFGLIGPDGAGKTTMMRLLAGLMRPTGGRATVCGYDTVRDAFHIKERVGYMAQQFSLYGDLTVAENLRFFGNVYGVDPAIQGKRFSQLLSFAGLERFRERRAAQLSGGMRKKLALACLLIHEPGVALLDEPTLGVDPVSRREFWNLLSALRAEKGLTILVCTPYMDEAERCHRVGLILDGELLACDTPANIKAMVSQELIQLRASDLRKAKEVLQDMGGVLELQTYGNLLHLFLDNAERREPEVKMALQAAGIGVEELCRVQPRMEQAFISLISRRRRQH